MAEERDSSPHDEIEILGMDEEWSTVLDDLTATASVDAEDDTWLDIGDEVMLLGETSDDDEADGPLDEDDDQVSPLFLDVRTSWVHDEAEETFHDFDPLDVSEVDGDDSEGMLFDEMELTLPALGSGFDDGEVLDESSSPLALNEFLRARPTWRGTVDAIAYDRVDGVRFAHVEGELWAATGDDDEVRLPAMGAPSDGIAQIVARGGRLLLVTVDGEVFRSEDGGRSFRIAGGFRDEREPVSAVSLVLDPLGNAWVVSGGGLYLSRDFGLSWRGPLLDAPIEQIGRAGDGVVAVQKGVVSHFHAAMGGGLSSTAMFNASDDVVALLSHKQVLLVATDVGLTLVTGGQAEHYSGIVLTQVDAQEDDLWAVDVDGRLVQVAGRSLIHYAVRIDWSSETATIEVARRPIDGEEQILDCIAVAGGLLVHTATGVVVIEREFRPF